MKAITLFIIITILALSKTQETLKTVSDDDLIHLVQTEPYVIALFVMKNKCPKCEAFEGTIVSIKNELIKEFGDYSLKLHNSQLTRIYTPSTSEPALVFFRHGIPLLYHGGPDPDQILHTFINNKEPSVKELTDETFEHLTQAATGATTGDWFIMFYTPDCVDCHRLVARWEAVASQLKARTNIARMNKAVDGVSTAVRFNVNEVPAFLLFKQGKLYRYHNQDFDVNSFLSFVKDWYKNMKPERIPLPKTPFDEFVEKVADILHKNALMWQISLLTTISAFILLIIIKYKKVSVQQEKKRKEKAKKK